MSLQRTAVGALEQTQLSRAIGRKNRSLELHSMLCLPASYTKSRKMLQNSIFESQITHVTNEVDTSNFPNYLELVAQIDRVRIFKWKEYREGGLLEPLFSTDSGGI
jgi:hypothetical protein